MTGKRFGAVVARFLLLLLVLCPVGVLAAASQPHPAMWKVRNGASTVYVLGSLHIVPPEFQWRTPEIDAAVRATDTFVFEVPVDQQAIQHQRDFIVHNGLLPSGTSLRAVLTPVEFRTYTRILHNAGLKPEQFERYRPWLAAVIVGLAYVHGRDIATLTGVDDVIIDYAQSRKKELRYLETIEQQMQLLTVGDDLAQVKALKRMIVALPNSRSHAEDLLEAWASGDTSRFDAMIDEDFKGHAEARDWLISRRNRVWLDPIKNLLDSGSKTAMVTVGAAHLGGPDGLIAMLCREGFGVQRVGAAGTEDSDACGAGA